MQLGGMEEEEGALRNDAWCEREVVAPPPPCSFSSVLRPLREVSAPRHGGGCGEGWEDWAKKDENCKNTCAGTDCTYMHRTSSSRNLSSNPPSA
jgi:hypothetical protein